MRAARAGCVSLLAVLIVFAIAGCRASHARDESVDSSRSEDAGAIGDATPPSVPDAGPPADDALPSTAVDDLSPRVKHLLEAIAHDDAQLATDIIFPRDGWLAMRDAVDPGKEWEKRVASALRRSIHTLSRHHTNIARAEFVSFQLGDAVTQQVPKRHGWKKPLWTVHGSRLTYTVDGRPHVLAVREMVAWRGAWYVTRVR